MENADAPVTKKDLVELIERMQATEQKLRRQLQETQDELGKVRDQQAELLNGYFSFRESLHFRLEGLETVQYLRSHRLDIVERRLSEIGFRNLLEPPAA